MGRGPYNDAMTGKANGREPWVQTTLVTGPAAVADMPWPTDCGAEAAFIGRTRGEAHPEHGPLLRLEYEVYAPMAQLLMRTMALDAAERWDCHAVRMVHAQGPVAPGEASVVIQVATPHRSEAFAACRYLIDRLKHELPIWKHEIWERGRTVVEGCCVHHEHDEPEPDDHDPMRHKHETSAADLRQGPGKS